MLNNAFVYHLIQNTDEMEIIQTISTNLWLITNNTSNIVYFLKKGETTQAVQYQILSYITQVVGYKPQKCINKMCIFKGIVFFSFFFSKDPY